MFLESRLWSCPHCTQILMLCRMPPPLGQVQRTYCHFHQLCRNGGMVETTTPLEKCLLFWMGPMQTKQVSALQKGPWRHLTWMWCHWLVLVLQPLDLMMALWKLVILLVLCLNLQAQLGKNLESVFVVYWDSTRSVATHTQQRCRRRLTTMSDFWPSTNVGPTQRSAPPLHHHPVQCRWCCRPVLHSLQTPQQLTCH